MKLPVPESLFNKVAGLRPATLLQKRLWHKCFPVNFAKFLRTPFLQNTSGWLLLTKLHDRNRRKLRLPYFELRLLLNVGTCHGILCLHFYFFCLETALQESNWMKTTSVVVFFPEKYHSESTWSQLCSKFFINNHETTWLEHLKDTL